MKPMNSRAVRAMPAINPPRNLQKIMNHVHKVSYISNVNYDYKKDNSSYLHKLY